MCLCNLNSRFTPTFLKITLIPISLCFAGIEKKSSKERAQSKEGRTCCSKHWFAEVIRFAKLKKFFTEAKRFAKVKKHSLRQRRN